MAQHRDPLDPHAEGEALDALRVVATRLDEAEHVGIDHAGAADLDPDVADGFEAALAALDSRRVAPVAPPTPDVGTDFLDVAFQTARDAAGPDAKLCINDFSTTDTAKRQALLDAGAPAVIATEDQDVVGEALRLTDGQGARVVFDPVGGPTVAKLAKAMGIPASCNSAGCVISRS